MSDKAWHPDLHVFEERKGKVNELFENMVACMDAGDDDGATGFLNDLNALTGKTHELGEFREFWGWTTKEDLIFNIALPAAPRNVKISREDLTEIVLILKDVEQFKYHDYYQTLVDNNFSYGSVADLIYHHSNLTVDEIVTKIMEHRPFYL